MASRQALALTMAVIQRRCSGRCHNLSFIVNDPGEGAQAKRRLSAVVLECNAATQADTHGVMAVIESLMDEYFEAAEWIKTGRQP